MLNKISPEKVFCGLDIGSQSLKAGLVRMTDASRLELLGVFELKTSGYRDGTVTDLSDFSECIHQTIQGLLKKTGFKVKEINIGINGELLEPRMTSALIPLVDKGAKTISQADINKVNYQARLLGLKTDEEIIHEYPQSYQVDDNGSVINPSGLYGRKLGVQSLLIVANVNRVRNIVKAVNEAGFDVGSISFTSNISSEVALDEKEKKEGCVLIDIGSEVTAVLVFRDGFLRYLDKINIGGENFTQRIAENQNLTFELAEEIKKSYAGAFSSENMQKEEILVKKENQYIPVKREAIVSAIQDEITLLVDTIRTSLKKSGYYEQLNRGIVVVGGGGLLPGLMERIGQETNLGVRLGKVSFAAQGFLTNAALFTSVAGLAQNGFRKSFKITQVIKEKANWPQTVASKVRELYQEYF